MLNDKLSVSVFYALSQRNSSSSPLRLELFMAFFGEMTKFLRFCAARRFFARCLRRRWMQHQTTAMQLIDSNQINNKVFGFIIRLLTENHQQSTGSTASSIYPHATRLLTLYSRLTFPIRLIFDGYVVGQRTFLNVNNFCKI